MLSKNEIKDIQSLSHKKFRKALKLFIAEGPKVVGELLQLVPAKIEKIYATSEWSAELSEDAEKKLTRISPEELERITTLKTPNQVLALVHFFDEKFPTGQDFTLYLDAIQDPGNLGTIIRIADWFNVTHIVCNKGCADLYNPKVVQATMASIARVSVYYDEDGAWLKKQTGPVYAAALDGISIYEMDKKMKGVLVIGNESKGISGEVMAYCTEKITIPAKG
ncbi:MAG: TrmH family RNA methyltransferase, partial [Flavisolibacter sp.]